LNAITQGRRMDDVLTRFVTDLIGRLTGPLSFRLLLQPGVAAFLSIRAGMADAREGRPPHLWRMMTGPPEARKRRVRETARAVLKVFILAVIIDCVYQWLVFRWFYPVEAAVTATVLAVVPYVALRGVVNRVARIRVHPESRASR
jgi:hypothetical protein